MSTLPTTLTFGPVLLINFTTGIIQDVSPVAAELFGYATADLIGQPMSMLIPVALRTSYATRQAAFLAGPCWRTQQIMDIRLQGLKRDGTIFTASCGLRKVLDGGGECTDEVMIAIQDSSLFTVAQVASMQAAAPAVPPDAI